MNRKLESLTKLLEKIPSSTANTENFLVKGLKVEQADSENSLVSLVLNYYAIKENIVVFTSPSAGKADAIADISKKINSSFVNESDRECEIPRYKCAVVTTEKYHKFLTSKGCTDVIVHSKLTNTGYTHLIFYNVFPSADIINTSINSTHISIFMDYEGLIDPKSYKNYIKEAVASLSSSFVYTTICKYPNKKKVDFLFGTNDNIKHITITAERHLFKDKHVLLYHSRQLEDHVSRFFNENAILTVSDLDTCLNSGSLQSNRLDPNEPSEGLNIIKCNCIVFYDINIDLTMKSLDLVDTVVVIYTKDNYKDVSTLGQILSKKGIEVPDFITKLNK